MGSHRLLGFSLAWVVAAGAFSSCKEPATAGTGGAGGTTTTTEATGGSADASAPDTGHEAGSGDAGSILCLAKNTNIPKGSCDLINQDCPAGFTCHPASSSSGPTTACVASFGLKTADEDCYTNDECDAKLVCIGLASNHPGKCVAFCCNDGESLPCNGGLCNEQVDFGGGNFAYVCSYGKRCQLLAPDACPAGYDCHVEPAAGQDIAVCLEPSPTPVGELGTCHYINDCGTMQDCYGIGGSGGGICLYYCALSGSTAAPGLGGCPSGETCESTYQGQPVDTGVDGVGLCIPAGGLHPDAGADGGDAGHGDAGGTDAGKVDAGGTDAGDGGIHDAAADG
jgi:hypothetical protein